MRTQKIHFERLTSYRLTEQSLNAGHKITFGHPTKKLPWTSTCNADQDEVRAGPKPPSARKLRLNLSAYPLHLQVFG